MSLSQSRVSSAVAARALTSARLCGVFPRGRVGRRKLACREGAFGVALAAEEHRATTPAAANELALPAFGANNAGLLLRLLDVLAVGVPGAADERAETTAAAREGLAALGADLAFEYLELGLLLALERLGVIATALGHWLALLALLESGARVEAPVPPELDDDGTAALRADPVGGLFGHIRLLHALRLLFDELAKRLEEVPDDRDPLDFTCGDPVEVLLHAHREAGVHDLGEVLVQEIGHDEADILRHESAAFLADVLTVHEGRDRRRVRRGPADPEFFEGLDKRRLGEARRRLREVLRRVEAQQLELLAGLHLGERRDLLLGLVGRFEVRAEESIEQDAAAVRSQKVLARLDVEARVLKARGRHLRRDRPLPDQRVELELVRLEEPFHAVRRAREIRRTDRLVRLLRALRACLVVTRLLERVRSPEFLRDDVARLMERALGDVERVGSHIGDESDRRAVADGDAFIELLREDHRFLHRVAELARCLLLDRRGGERRRGIAAALALLDALDCVTGICEGGTMLIGSLTVMDLELVALLLDDLGAERFARVVGERGLESPVLLRLERLDLALAVDDEPECDRLDATRGEAVADLLPKERRHRVADQPVDDPARLLSIHEVLIDLPRMLERFLDGGRGDLVEGDPAQLGLWDLDDVGQVPGDGLALAVEVSGQPDMVRGLGLSSKGPGVLFRIVRDDVFRDEGLEIDAHLRLRQIPDMPERGLDLVVGTEHPF